MRNTMEKLKQTITYFKTHHSLPKGKPQRADEDEVDWDLGHFEFRFQSLAELDNEPDDLDDRPGHVLVNEDPSVGGPMAASFSGDIERGQVEIDLLREDEQHHHQVFMSRGQFVDVLYASDSPQKGLEFVARHIDRFSQEKNTEQHWQISQAHGIHEKPTH